MVSKRTGRLSMTTSFAQRDCPSPLLFSRLVGDIPERIQERHSFLEAILYADDLALISYSEFHLRQLLAPLVQTTRPLRLEINAGKTVSMKISKTAIQACISEFRLARTQILCESLPISRADHPLKRTIPESSRGEQRRIQMKFLQVRHRDSQCFQKYKLKRFTFKK